MVPDSMREEDKWDSGIFLWRRIKMGRYKIKKCWCKRRKKKKKRNKIKGTQ
jgi:hypothetical protein